MSSVNRNRKLPVHPTAEHHGEGLLERQNMRACVHVCLHVPLEMRVWVSSSPSLYHMHLTMTSCKEGYIIWRERIDHVDI